jgi:DNA-binding transcriptional LysR family regulator
MTLTASGELVLSHSDAILDCVDTLRKELHYLQGKSSGHLLIGASPVPANTIIGPAIGRFIELHPDVHVDLKVATWQEHIQQLLQGKLSLLVTDIKGEALGHEALLQTFNLPSYHAVFCARKTHPLAVKPELTLADIRDYPLAIPRNLPTGVMESFADLFSPYRVDFAGLLHYDTFQPIKAALQHSQMLALTPQVNLLEGQTKSSLCVLKPIDMPPLDVCFSIVMLKKQNNLAANRFLHLLLSSVTASSVS